MYNTPLPVDIYSRTMIDLFNESSMIGVSTGFQSLFGNPANASKTIFSPNSSVVEIDIMRGNEKTAALVQRGQLSSSNENTKNITQQDFTTFSRLYPLSEEKSVITADQLNKRLAGENPYMGLTKFDRVKELAKSYHDEHMRRMVRLFERLSAQSVLTGKMDGILNTSNTGLQYDFRRNAQNTFTPAVKWDQATATIMADIDAACDVARVNGKINSDFLIAGSAAMQAMIDNTKFQDKSDNRRFELIMVSDKNPVPAKFDRMIESGFKARGRLLTASGYELWIFTYIDVYEDEQGNSQKYMPEDKVLIGSTQARADRYFGPDEHMPMGTARLDMISEVFGIQNPATMSMPEIKNMGAVVNPLMFSYDAYSHHENKGVVCRTQSAPIFATTMTDAWVVIEDVLTP